MNIYTYIYIHICICICMYIRCDAPVPLRPPLPPARGLNL